MREPWVWFLGQEDPLEKEMATHTSTLAWKMPWTEELGRLQSMGLLRVGHYWATSLSFSLPCIGEGNGNPLQCSCLENPRDGGAWWAAIYGVIQSWTRLKRLSSSSSSGLPRWWTHIHMFESLQLEDSYVGDLLYIKLNHFAVHLKLTQHCKSTILQFKKYNV